MCSAFDDPTTYDQAPIEDARSARPDLARADGMGASGVDRRDAVEQTEDLDGALPGAGPGLSPQFLTGT